MLLWFNLTAGLVFLKVARQTRLADAAQAGHRRAHKREGTAKCIWRCGGATGGRQLVLLRMFKKNGRKTFLGNMFL